MSAGTLYIVATPIGNLDDISRRALDILQGVSVIAAEDTRHTRKLLQHFNVTTRLLAYHDFSTESASTKILAQLQQGDDVALVSDAGTPLISDPGFKLVRAAREAQIPVIPVPGPSALVTALSVAGLPTDRFAFEGFLPEKTTARRKLLGELQYDPRTLVFYESSHRIASCVEDMAAVLGTQRLLFVGRELTKKFESHCLGTIAQCLEWLQADDNQRRGEFVLVLAGCDEEQLQARVHGQALALAAALLDDMSLKRAAAVAAKATGARKNALYTALLEKTAP